MSDSDATLPDDAEFEVNESSTNPPNVSAKSKRTNPKTKPKNKSMLIEMLNIRLYISFMHK